MPDLGIDVLLKGSNMLRLLQGVGVAVQISLVSIAISMPLGIVVGSLMTVKTKHEMQFAKSSSRPCDLYGWRTDRRGK